MLRCVYMSEIFESYVFWNFTEKYFYNKNFFSFKQMSLSEILTWNAVRTLVTT